MTVVVTEWRAAEAVMLQQALRMTNEAFAEKLGAATRTVAKWRSQRQMRLTLEMQEALDTLLVTAADQVAQRFDALWRQAYGDPDQGLERWRERLAEATHLHRTIGWLDQQRANLDGQNTYSQVVNSAAARAASPLHGTVWASTLPARARLADVVRDYYRDGFDVCGPVTLTTPGAEPITTTMLAAPEWLTLDDELLPDRGHFAYEDTDKPISLRPPSAGLLAAATNRLATILVTGTRFVDETLYRLTDYRLAGDGLHATFALGSFGQYALTGDLLESEAAAAADTGSAAGMPLRDELLPTVESVLTPQGRLCVGGTLALAAFARPARGPKPADFLLLLQERGEQVLNAGHRLAVIPKCFHQPMVDLVEDAHIGATLVRELEEELFGREEVDNSLPHPAFVEPMHRTRLSRPLRWLWAHPAAWVMEGTGFAFNLLSGNFEVPALIAVRDEKFWQRHGGAVQANWESTRLIRMSSMNADGLAKLLADPAWSDEGLMAFVLGLKRLARLDPARVKLPPFQTGVLR